MWSPHRVLWTLLLALPVTAQGPPANGPQVNEPTWHALINGDLIPQPGKRIAKATVVIKDGRIVSVSEGGAAPAGARVWDCTGLTLYPGLIDAFVTVDAPAPDPGAPDVHWNKGVLPQRSALDGIGATTEERKSLRSLGFCAAAIAPTGGTFKGSAAVVQLGEPRTGERPEVLRQRAYHLLGFQSGSDYPSSEMGVIALMRQILMDADWRERCAATITAHAELGPLPADAALAALAGRELPLCFDVQDELQVLRAAKVAEECNRFAFAIGSGMEFRRAQAVAKAGLRLVLPLDYPETPDVSSLAKAEGVSLRQLWSWEQAQTNTKRLLDAGCVLAWTTARLKDRKDFTARAADAIACGVTLDQALAMLTTTPAELLGVQTLLGTVEPGKVANLAVMRGVMFSRGAEVTQVWIGGRPYDVAAERDEGLEGSWTASLELPTKTSGTLKIAGDKVSLEVGEKKVSARKVQSGKGQLDFLLADAVLGEEGQFSLHALREGEALHGTGRTPQGQLFAWSAQRTGALPAKETTIEVLPPPVIGPLPVPFEAFGLTELPQPQNAVFSGCKLWTSGPRGVIERGALWVRDGKIAFAGPSNDLPVLPPGTAVIDVTGKQVTPGIIDCHSHTGISRGVNEGGQAVTSEVRIQDVVNPDDVGWYRELAGGVTAVNQLHGSANAIGGQSWTVKLRWGVPHPDGMAVEGSTPGIKFALGENPRRVNGSNDSTRYPGTRMGVEALIRDRFAAAADYRERMRRYLALDARGRSAVLPPRRDLELEALAEILDNKRWIHCHSYRQDEILMLCSVAKEHGFKIGTFQHVLEGYKVADAISRQAVGASAFSDWWAYKLEVQDAIPDNGAIMREQGVVVSFNSDSNEMARRLNTEAGKAVKYGNVPPGEALKFVTLNPALQLGIGERTGSLERGKDADFVIWSGDPLSYLSRCEATYIDGRPWFTSQRDQELRDGVMRERNRLLQRAQAASSQTRKTPGENESTGLDAYWRAEDRSGAYCCRECEGGGK